MVVPPQKKKRAESLGSPALSKVSAHHTAPFNLESSKSFHSSVWFLSWNIMQIIKKIMQIIIGLISGHLWRWKHNGCESTSQCQFKGPQVTSQDLQVWHKQEDKHYSNSLSTIPWALFQACNSPVLGSNPSSAVDPIVWFPPSYKQDKLYLMYLGFLGTEENLNFAFSFFFLVLHFFCFLMSDWNNLTGSQRKFKKVKSKPSYQYSLVQNSRRGQAE